MVSGDRCWRQGTAEAKEGTLNGSKAYHSIGKQRELDRLFPPSQKLSARETPLATEGSGDPALNTAGVTLLYVTPVW